ncbi:MAG: MATE family efflux transporter [Eubacteriales bacterium]|nr:MATE family efflux transporter [Eubacteriales bacterium]
MKSLPSSPAALSGQDMRSFLRMLAAIAIPVALQNLLTTTGSMVDTVMLAQLGELTVGSVGLCAQFSSLLFSCYWGFVGGGMLFFAQHYGAKDGDGVCSSYGLTLSCMLTVGLLFCLLGVLAPETVMGLYTDKPELQAIGVQYLRIVGFAYPLQVLSMAMSALLRTTDRVRLPLIASIVSLLTNFLFNYLLIFGKLGLPRMGVQGAALATVISGAVNVLMLLAMGKATQHPYLLQIKRHFCWSKAFIQKYLLKCFPILCNELLIGVGNMVINIVLGRQSTQAIAALAVFRTFEGFIIAFFAGFTNAASILVGTEVGAGHHELAFARAKRLIVLCPVTICGACLLMLAIHPPLLTAMSLSGESFEICRSMLIIYTFVAVIRMCNWIQNDTFRSAGDAAFGTILEITFMYLLVLPCICLTGLVFKAPFLLIFASAYVDEPIRIVIMLRHAFSGKWIKPVTKEGLATIDEFRAAHGIKQKNAAELQH